MQDDDFDPRPGRIRHGNQVAKRPKSFVGEVMRAAKKAGHRGRAFGQSGRAGAARPSAADGGRHCAWPPVRPAGASSSWPGSYAIAAAVFVRRRSPSTSPTSNVRVSPRRRRRRMFDTTSDDADTKAFAERCRRTGIIPHIHVLVRGRADDGQDLVISRDYINQGFRGHAAERVTLELGPRSGTKSAPSWRRRSMPSVGPASTDRSAPYPTGRR